MLMKCIYHVGIQSVSASLTWLVSAKGVKLTTSNLYLVLFMATATGDRWAVAPETYRFLRSSLEQFLNLDSRSEYDTDNTHYILRLRPELT